MFPQRVYHCSCVSLLIKLCLVNGLYSLKDIVGKLKSEYIKNGIYFCKCGNDLQNVVFSCREHMSMVTLCEKDNRKCRRCMIQYLKTAYDCCYNYTNFDLPLSIKKEKKVLRLIVEKL